VLDDVCDWLKPRLDAVFAGRGTFHLEDGDRRHVVRARLGWFRRKRRRRLAFAPYE
jgi:hypothetical protein